jgi:hypothetical protein
MSSTSSQRFVVLPMYLTGIGSMLLGLAWIIYPEPWLLDKWANEILLQTRYDILLTLPGNEYLGAYLKGLYGFFGLWIFSLGLLIAAYVRATNLASRRYQNFLYGTLCVVAIASYILIFTYIPTSHFLWINHGVVAAVTTSFMFSRLANGRN